MAYARSFRLICPPSLCVAVEALLRAEGYDFIPEPFSPWCRQLTQEPRPLGGSLAAFFGYIYIQDRSSMLPPLALNPAEGMAVLDMCASPGSKTGFLAQLTGKEGFVLANEPTRSRLGTLRANMHSLNFLQVATCAYAGEKLPLAHQTWDAIQVDTPCSGWGTVVKNPHVRTLWTQQKTKPLIVLQRRLLEKATALLRPGGVLVYSTCTTHTAENEAQALYAMEYLGLHLEPLPAFEGFVWEAPAPGAEGSLRVDGVRSHAQGFYLARLRKPAHEDDTADSMQHHALSSYIPAYTPPHALAPIMLTAPCIDTALLPQGILTQFGDTVRFIPHKALTLLPQDMLWQAATVGRMAGDQIICAPRIRALMPSPPPQEALVLEDIADIRALLQGQSKDTGLPGKETGLYWRELPLGRVGLKRGRAVLSIH